MSYAWIAHGPLAAVALVLAMQEYHNNRTTLGAIAVGLFLALLTYGRP